MTRAAGDARAVAAGRIDIVAVSVGLPAPIGVRQGAVVVSGIRKTPVRTATVRLGAENLEGDAQADRRAHGGADKALFAYPVEHLEAWSAELGETLGPGAFGENLTLRGVLEDGVHIGEVLGWGDALLQVAQPRWPCFKLAMHRGRPDLVERFVASRRCGFYLRVLRPAVVPVTGALVPVRSHPPAVTVAEMFEAAVPGAVPPERAGGLAAHAALGAGWRATLHRRARVAENAAS